MSHDLVRRADKYHEESDLRFLLVGMTGCGKSTTGNTILGREEFDSKVSFKSVTESCSLKHSTRFGRTIGVLDSPGLFDTSKTHEEVSQIVMQAVACMYPGPDAVLYVIKIGRYTKEEFGVYNRLKALLDDRVTKHIIVIFTFGDTLKGEDIEEILKESPRELQQVLEECSKRYVVFNNTAKNKSQQVQDLLSKAKRLQTENQLVPYQCPKYASIGKKMEAEMSRRLAEIEKEECERKKYVQGLNQKLGDVERKADEERREFQLKEWETNAKTERMNRQMQYLRIDLHNALLDTQEQEETLYQFQRKRARERRILTWKLQRERSRRDNMFWEKQAEIDTLAYTLEQRTVGFQRYHHETWLAGQNSAAFQQLHQRAEEYDGQLATLPRPYYPNLPRANPENNIRAAYMAPTCSVPRATLGNTGWLRFDLRLGTARRPHGMPLGNWR